MSNRIDRVVARIQNARVASEMCWEMAEDTASSEASATEWHDMGASCDEHYSDALESVERGDYAEALESLEQARSIESDGGDDQHARVAIAALRSVLSDSAST